MSTATRPTVRALFRLAAGSRLGFGHLVRGRVLARALGITDPIVSLRGAAPARRAAKSSGFRLAGGSPREALRRVRPAVLILDDPSRAAARPWVGAARALAIPVVSVHDLGRAFCGADLTIDGSIVPPGSTPRGLLAGPSFAILDPAVRELGSEVRDPNSVLVALGGGPRLGVAIAIAQALRAFKPELRIRIAGGFAGVDCPIAEGITCLGPRNGLASELATCALAITGGGVSLYEAAALDTPTVAWPVVRAQHQTVTGFHRRGLAFAILPGRRRMPRLVDAVAATLADRSARRTSTTIDGLGARRVADAIQSLVQRDSREAA